MELQRTPLLRIVLPFIIGLLINYYYVIPFPTILIGLGFSLLLLLYFMFAKSNHQTKLSLTGWAGIAINFALFFAGSFSSYNSNALNNSNHLTYTNNYQKLWVRIVSPPEEKAKTHKIVANVKQVFNGDTLHITTGKILLYLSKTGFDSTIKYGDYLLVNNTLNPPPTAIGVDSFNYAKWLSYQNIYYQGFLKTNDYIRTDKNSTNPIFSFGYDTRNYFDNILRHYLPDSNTYSVASAIILGIRNHIDDDLTQAYARTGTIHILAVSGLHVGGIYLLLALLLGIAGKRKWAALLKVIIMLGGLWLYALITGLSPSVVRATTMFSFIAVGDAIERKTNIFNSLAAAALFTLVIDANAIFQVGFQLSYLAVAGIGLFYNPLVRLLTPRTWLFTKIWQLLCISFAAQVATAPLAIYYFHQFPNYFLISNLLIVPFGILSVYLGLLLLLTSPLAFMATWVGKTLDTVISINNFIAQQIESLPFAYTPNLYLNEWSVLVIYGSILSLFLYLKTKKPLYLICLLTLLIALTILI